MTLEWARVLCRHLDLRIWGDGLELEMWIWELPTQRRQVTLKETNEHLKWGNRGERSQRSFSCIKVKGILMRKKAMSRISTDEE